MSLGTVVLDEMVFAVTGVELANGGFRVTATIVSPQEFKRNDVLRGLRIHDNEGTLVTTVADYVQPIGRVTKGQMMRIEVDVLMEDKISHSTDSKSSSFKG